MPVFSPTKHFARSRYRDTVLADNPLWYLRMKLPRTAYQNFPVDITDETGQYDCTFSEGSSGVLFPTTSGMIKADASPSLGWTGTSWGGGSIAHDSSLQPKGSFSLETWFTKYDTRDVSIITKDRFGSAWPEYTFNLNNGQVTSTLYTVAGTSNISQVASPLTNYNDGNIHHAVVVFNTDANMHYLYVDGEEVDSNPWAFTLYQNTESITIGQQTNAPTNYANIKLDEVAMYHYALTPGQIENHWNVGRAIYDNYRRTVLQSNPISYWRFAEQAPSTSAADEQGINPLTKNGDSVKFGHISPLHYEDNSNDNSVLIPGVNYLRNAAPTGLANLPTNGGSPGGFAVEFWMLPLSDGEAGFGTVVGTEDAGNGWRVYISDATVDTYQRLRMKGIGSINDNWDSAPVRLKEWTHVVINYHFTTYCQMYFNGVPVTTTQNTIGSNWQSDTGNQITVGDRQQGDRNWDGYLDEVAIYDRPLTEKEITQHYKESNLQKAKEDFYGYEPGNFFPGNFNPRWTIEQTNSTDVILDQGADPTFDSKHLQCTLTSTGESHYTFKDVPPFHNGIVQVETSMENGSGSLRIPALMVKYVDSNNHLMVRVHTDANELQIDEVIGGVANITGTPISLALNTIYYYEVVLQDSQCIATVYTDPEKETISATLSAPIQQKLGKAGIAAVGASGNVYHYDNFRVDVTDFALPLIYSTVIFEDNPVAYWRLDDFSGTTAIEEIGGSPIADMTYVNTPTLADTTLVTDGSSVNFNGSTEYATVDEHRTPATGDFTWECWMKTNVADSSFRLMDIRGSGAAGSQNGVQLSSTSGSDWDNTIFDDGGGNFIRMSGAPLTQNDAVPHHIILTWDASTGTARLFSDGELQDVQTNANLIGETWAQTRPFRIATASNSGTTHNFGGAMDEVVIYDYILSPVRIAHHYNIGSQTGLYGGYKAEVLYDQPVRYYKMDESSGSLVDIGSGSVNATLNAGTPTYRTPGLLSADFSGTSITFSGSEYYQANAYTYTNDMTVEAWIKRSDTIASTEVLVEQYSALAAEGGFLLYVNASGAFGLDVKTIGSFSYKSNNSVVDVCDGNPHHIAAVISGNVVTLYLDGVVTTKNNSNDLTGATYINTPMNIGANRSGADTATLYYSGVLDEISLYDEALSAERIQQHYAAGVGIDPLPLGQWELDDVGSPVVAANSGYSGGDGTYVGAPTLGVTGLKSTGTAVTFDNSGTQYVETGVTMTSPHFTLSCWVNIPHVPGTGGGVPNYGPMYQDTRGIIWDHTDAGFRGAGYVQVPAGANFYAASFGTLLANTTYHLAITYDGLNLISYKDGVAITTTPIVSQAIADTTSLRLMETSATGNRLDGTLDDARVYERALLATEILAMYNAGI